MKTLYHLTNKKSIPDIKTLGLMPGIGYNSGRVNEDRPPATYLTSGESLPYWRILLDCDALIKVDASCVDESDLRETLYQPYTEFAYDKIIPASALSVVPLPRRSRRAMRVLCSNIFDAIQLTCKLAASAHFHANDPPDGYDELVESYKSHLSCAVECGRKLDFSVLTQAHYRNKMTRDAENGEYVMTDRYLPTLRNPNTKRLWEMLNEYPESETSERERELYALITKNWTTETLSIETGGWSKD